MQMLPNKTTRRTNNNNVEEQRLWPAEQSGEEVASRWVRDGHFVGGGLMKQCRNKS